MDFEQLIRLPVDCANRLDKLAVNRDAASVKELFRRFFVGKNTLIVYSLDSVERFKPIKLPAQVWREKRGHCFETSLFWLACMRHLGIRSWYCEKFPCIWQGKVWDHAFVNAELEGKTVQMDPGRRIVSARFKTYRQLNERQTIGTYYADCALMLDPYNTNQRKVKLSAVLEKRLARRAFGYARLALEYDPKQERIPNFARNIRARYGDLAMPPERF